jgi:hypothetical protein
MKQRFQIPVNFLTIYELITMSLRGKKYPATDIVSDKSYNF